MNRDTGEGVFTLPGSRFWVRVEGSFAPLSARGSSGFEHRVEPRATNVVNDEPNMNTN